MFTAQSESAVIKQCHFREGVGCTHRNCAVAVFCSCPHCTLRNGRSCPTTTAPTPPSRNPQRRSQQLEWEISATNLKVLLPMAVRLVPLAAAYCCGECVAGLIIRLRYNCSCRHWLSQGLHTEGFTALCLPHPSTSSHLCWACTSSHNSTEQLLWSKLCDCMNEPKLPRGKLGPFPAHYCAVLY